MTKHCPECGSVVAQGVSRAALETLEYIRRKAPQRGGYIYEGARPEFEKGNYIDNELRELLDAGLIAPHSDPRKGWIIVQHMRKP